VGVQQVETDTAPVIPNDSPPIFGRLSGESLHTDDYQPDRIPNPPTGEGPNQGRKEPDHGRT
jgi:hypothetical protein